MRTRALTDAVLLVAVFVALMFVALYFPLGFALIAVLAIPHAIIAYKHGLSTGFLAVVVSAVLLFLFADVFIAVSNVALFALPGTVMGYAAKRWGAVRAVLLAAATVVIATVALFLAFQALMGTNLVNEMRTMMNYALEDAKGMYRALGADVTAVEQLQGMVDTLLIRILPASLVIFGFALSYVNYSFFYLFGKRLRFTVPRVAGILEWQFPKWMGVAFLFGWLAMVLPLDAYPWLQDIGLNVYAVFTWVVLGQGLSLFALLLHKYNVPRFVLTIMVLIVIFNPLLIQIVSLVGLFDMFFSYKEWIMGRS